MKKTQKYQNPLLACVYLVQKVKRPGSKVTETKSGSLVYRGDMCEGERKKANLFCEIAQDERDLRIFFYLIKILIFVMGEKYLKLNTARARVNPLLLFVKHQMEYFGGENKFYRNIAQLVCNDIFLLMDLYLKIIIHKLLRENFLEKDSAEQTVATGKIFWGRK